MGRRPQLFDVRSLQVERVGLSTTWPFSSMPKLLLNLSQLHCFPFGQFIDFEDKHSSVFDRNNIYASELAKLSDLLRRFKDKLF